MKILLFGAASAVAWVMDFMRRALATVDDHRKPELVAVQGAPTHELLASLLAEPIEALILANHAPFTLARPQAISPNVIQAEAQRAVLAIELSRRAMKTLSLERREAENWPVSLDRLLGQLSAVPRSHDCALWPSWSEAQPIAFEPPQTGLLATYLQPLFAVAERSQPLTFVWPRECFLDGDAPGEILPATVEVAGRARILAYGPYLPLPSGGWKATAFLGFSPGIVKMPFILEVDSGGAVSRGYFETEGGGFFTLELDFQTEDALYPVELRLISQDSALEGQLSLIEVRLEQDRSDL